MSNVNVTVSTSPVTYVRQQKGHSIILNLLFGGIFLYIPAIYYAISPNHYYHL